MFTGLVEEVGHVRDVDHRDGGARLWIDAATVCQNTEIGDSIAVDGACLTVVELDKAGFAIDAVAETLARTCLSDRSAGSRVNLERALPAQARLGGHIVQGHIDGTACIERVEPEGVGFRMHIAAPPELMKYVIEKGSVAVDGVSLTVADRDPHGFQIALIPHTMQATTLHADSAGRDVNIEVDVVAKYVEAFAGPYLAQERTQ